jgi:archaellum biogenesis protein FlaJ (TadC family)
MDRVVEIAVEIVAVVVVAVTVAVVAVIETLVEEFRVDENKCPTVEPFEVWAPVGRICRQTVTFVLVVVVVESLVDENIYPVE